jgi:hypothetical protein
MRKYYGRYNDFVPPSIENCLTLDEELLYYETVEEHDPNQIETAWQQLAMLLCEGIRNDMDNEQTMILGQELLRWTIKKDVYAVSLILQTHRGYFNEKFLPQETSEELDWLLDILGSTPE